MLIKGTKGWSGVNQGNEGDELKIFLCARRDRKTLLKSSANCQKYSGCESGWNSQLKADVG